MTHDELVEFVGEIAAVEPYAAKKIIAKIHEALEGLTDAQWKALEEVFGIHGGNHERRWEVMLNASALKEPKP